MDNPKAGSCIADRKMSSGNQAQQEDDDQKAAAVILDQKQTTASPQKVLRAENETTPTSTAALVDDIEQYCQEMEALSLTTSPFSSSSSSSPVGKTAGSSHGINVGAEKCAPSHDEACSSGVAKGRPTSQETAASFAASQEPSLVKYNGYNDRNSTEFCPETAMASAKVWADAITSGQLEIGLAFGLPGNDDASKVLRWLLHGKLDANHFAKVLPQTTKIIQRQSRCQSVHHTLRQTLRHCKGLFEICLERTMLSSLRVSNVSGGFHGNLVQLLAYRLTTSEVLPIWWCRNEKDKEWLTQKVHPEFARDFLRNIIAVGLYDDLLKTAARVIHERWAPEIIEVLCWTCADWEDRVDQALFKGKRSGTFRFFCRRFFEYAKQYLNNNTSTDHGGHEITCMVCDYLQEAWGCEEYKNRYNQMVGRFGQLSASFVGVSFGHNGSSKTCFECMGALSASAPKNTCSKCGVALYCSRRCQKIAWKSGHKEKCATLKAKHELYMESFRSIDKSNIPAASFARQVQVIIANQTVIDVNPFEPMTFRNAKGEVVLHGKPAGPSIAIFQANLERILRNEFWLYADTNAEEYREKVTLCRRKEEPEETIYFFELCRALSCSIVEYAQDGAIAAIALGITPENSLLATIDFIARTQRFISSARDGVGISMPRERFIEIMYSVSHSSDGGTIDGDPRRRSNEKAYMMTTLRENFHK